MARKRKSGGVGGVSGRDVERAVGAFAKLDAGAQLLVIALIVVVGVAAGIWYWREQQRKEAARDDAPSPVVRTEPAPPAPAGTSAPRAAVVTGPGVHLLLGNPSGATADVANRGNYLMLKPYYAMSYNEPAGGPNWVSWRVTRDDVRGNSARRQVFDEDSSLPAGFLRITHRDYSQSGFDRGHLCPHADRDATPEMTASTFVMSNILPQAPNLNQGAWADLEEYCRLLVNREPARLYVVAGGSGVGGVGSMGKKETVGGGRVRVPAECWKVIVVVPESGAGGGGGGEDLSRINTGTRVIAVMMPNDHDALKGKTWGPYRVSVAEVEKRTGYRFFDRLPAEVAAALKAKVDRGATR